MEDSLLAQVERQLLNIPGVEPREAATVARILIFGDSLRPRSPEEKLAIAAIFKKMVHFEQGY